MGWSSTDGTIAALLPADTTTVPVKPTSCVEHCIVPGDFVASLYKAESGPPVGHLDEDLKGQPSFAAA